MWLVPRLFALVLGVQYSIVRNVVSEDCRFVWPNGTDLEEDKYGTVELQRIRDDAKPGTILLSLSTEYVEKIRSTTHHTDSNLSYFQLDYNQLQNSLTLSLTDDFEKYEEVELLPSFSITVIFDCVGSTTKELEFVQPVQDINTHKPEFQRTPYIYLLPMPFPKGLPFGSIYARDIDMTNTNITFYFDSADPNVAGLSVSWSSRDINDRKLYSASLSTKSVINFLDDVTFVLYANDTPPAGSASTNSFTPVTIQVDRKNSVFRFASPLYRADLTDLTFDDANGKTITFSEGDIVLSGNVDSQVVYTIQDELTGYSDNFELFRIDDRSTVQIRLKNLPAKFFQESSVLLKLTARKSAATESTIIHLSLPGSATDVRTEYEETSNDVPVIVLGVLLAIVTVSLIVIVVRKQGFWAALKNKIIPNSEVGTHF